MGGVLGVMFHKIAGDRACKRVQYCNLLCSQRGLQHLIVINDNASDDTAAVNFSQLRSCRRLICKYWAGYNKNARWSAKLLTITAEAVHGTLQRAHDNVAIARHSGSAAGGET